MMVCCAHADKKKFGRDRKGNQRYRCIHCGKTWTEAQAKPLGKMTVPVDKAKLVLKLLTQGLSVRATGRATGIDCETIGKLILFFGRRCRDLLDARMVNLKPTHLQFDEQWTYVFKKQSRLRVALG